MRGYVALLSAAGLLLGPAAGGAAAVSPAPPAGSHHAAAARTANSLSVSISGVPKARVKVKGAGFHHVVRSSTVLRLPAGTYRVRAFKVKRQGTAYMPDHRSHTLRASGGRSFVVTVQYTPVGQVDSHAADQQVTPASPVPDGPLGTLVQLVNQARSKGRQCGTKSMPAVPPVTFDAELSEAAQAHAKDMAVRNYFSHDSLDGRSFVARIRATGYAGSPAGENIASGFTTAEATLQGWLNSPGHCVNLMDPDFADMGLGYAVREDPSYSTGVTYWVQDFGFGSD